MFFVIHKPLSCLKWTSICFTALGYFFTSYSPLPPLSVVFESCCKPSKIVRTPPPPPSSNTVIEQFSDLQLSNEQTLVWNRLREVTSIYSFRIYLLQRQGLRQRHCLLSALSKTRGVFIRTAHEPASAPRHTVQKNKGCFYFFISYASQQQREESHKGRLNLLNNQWQLHRVWQRSCCSPSVWMVMIFLVSFNACWPQTFICWLSALKYNECGPITTRTFKFIWCCFCAGSDSQKHFDQQKLIISLSMQTKWRPVKRAKWFELSGTTVTCARM